MTIDSAFRGGVLDLLQQAPPERHASVGVTARGNHLVVWPDGCRVRAPFAKMAGTSSIGHRSASPEVPACPLTTIT